MARRCEHLARRSLQAVFLCALSGLVAAGCGGSAGVSQPTRSTPTRSTVRPYRHHITTTSFIPPGQRLRGDGDADNPNDIDGNGDEDGAEDNDDDRPTSESYRFPDSDDAAIFAYGHRAPAAVASAIATVVRGYYAAAAANNGAAACALLDPRFVGAVAEDYGQAGPAYLRGGKTCQAVMSMLFKHFHEQLAEAITVVDVRVSGDRAEVVFSSRSMPASDIFLQREHGSWGIDGLIGNPLP
jgi:hypothetical protein